jgi:holliday junction DNA helicase RuvA
MIRGLYCIFVRERNKMISRLHGIVLEKNPPLVVVDVHGVGYEAQVSMQTFYTLPALGEQVQLFTQLVVREDAHLLFGFSSREERETFQALVKVSGIGAKSALGILSALTSDELASAIANEDIKRLTTAPGIGKKTAERMVLELRGKLVSSNLNDGLILSATNSQHDDIINTLLALGYNDKEARNACKSLPEGTDISEGVRLALKNML